MSIFAKLSLGADARDSFQKGECGTMRNKSFALFASFAFALALLGFVQPADARVLFGSVSGIVTDSSGAAVPKAHGSIVNKASGVRKESDTDASGHYTITDLPPGVYDLTVSATGFKPLTQTNLTITANIVSNADFKLQVGSVSEMITVEASAAVLQTEKTDINTVLSEKAVLDMPLNQYRNYQTLINLV